MVGIVLVSHSRALAVAVRELVLSMTGGESRLALAAGVGEDRRELGTDAIEISEAIRAVHGPDGVLVIMDMGSALLSAETALELLDEPERRNVVFCSAPFVEGAVAAGVTAHMSAPLEQVKAEALQSLQAKKNALPEAEAIEEPAKLPPVGMPSGAQVLRLTIPNRHGLHARPVTRLIREMTPFASELTVRNLTNQRGPVSLKSLSAIAALEILHGHEIEITAIGQDASAALAKARELVESGLGDDLAAERAQTASLRNKSTSPLPLHRPIPVSPGIAIGPTHDSNPRSFSIPTHKSEDAEHETQRLQKAIAVVKSALQAKSDAMTGAMGTAAKIYEAQTLALQDPDLFSVAAQLISDERDNAIHAWEQAKEKIVARYAVLTDPYLRERAGDYEDVSDQVLAQLGAVRSTSEKMMAPGILVADDLSPGQVSELDPNLVLGVILRKGGPTAHSSILLKALGIPTLVQAQNLFENNRPHIIAFDGATGEAWLDPSIPQLEELRRRQREAQDHASANRHAALQPAVTADGHRVHVAANIGSVSEATKAAASGAEGVGLLRTEFLFLERTAPPSEEEQFQALRAIIACFPSRPVIVRTLDIGGDKEVSYLSLPRETNPFLGVRALRLCFTHEELFVPQLRAILRASHGAQLQIMFPMVADRGDLLRARALLEQVHQDLTEEKIHHNWPLPVGIMIEIPAAALQAESLAETADFFSIGTNDLTQYTLAADRGNPELLPYQDAAHPAVLRLVRQVVQGANRHGRPVAVCGEAASDEFTAALLVGLGVQELSVSIPAIARLKASLRRQKLHGLQALAERALACRTTAEVRELAREL